MSRGSTRSSRVFTRSATVASTRRMTAGSNAAKNESKALVTAGHRRPWTNSIEPAEAICRLHEEPGVPGICLHGVDWGTVGSTIIGLPLDVSQSVYHYAAGPPCSTAYVDYSQSLRNLLVRS